MIDERDPDQAWFWTSEWQAGEDEASQNIEGKAYKVYGTMDELLEDLFGDDDIQGEPAMGYIPVPPKANMTEEEKAEYRMYLVDLSSRVPFMPFKTVAFAFLIGLMIVLIVLLHSGVKPF